jgi:hypothetical protein
LWSSPNPRDRQGNWRFLGIFASAQDAENASDEKLGEYYDKKRFI